MKHLTRPDASHKRIWTRPTNASGCVRCFIVCLDACGRVRKINACERVCDVFWAKEIILFSQIRTASPSNSHVGKPFQEAQNKSYIYLANLNIARWTRLEHKMFDYKSTYLSQWTTLAYRYVEYISVLIA